MDALLFSLLSVVEGYISALYRTQCALIFCRYYSWNYCVKYCAIRKFISIQKRHLITEKESWQQSDLSVLGCNC